MKEILKENQDYILAVEKIAGKWWLELHARATGICQILYCNTKKIAVEAYKKNGELLEFNKIKDLCNKMKLEEVKIYKENL